MAGDWSSELHETNHCGFYTSHLPLSFKLSSAQCWHTASPLSTQPGCFSICFSSKPIHCRWQCVLKNIAFSTTKGLLKICWFDSCDDGTIKNYIFWPQAAYTASPPTILSLIIKCQLLLIIFHSPIGGQGTLAWTICPSCIPGMIRTDTCDCLFQSAVQMVLVLGLW